MLAKSNPMPLPVCHPSPSQNIPQGTIYLLLSVHPRSGFPPLSFVWLQKPASWHRAKVWHRSNWADQDVQKIYFTTLIHHAGLYFSNWNCWVPLFIQDWFIHWWFMTADKVYGLFVKGGCSPDCQVMIYAASDEHTVTNVCFKSVTLSVQGKIMTIMTELIQE